MNLVYFARVGASGPIKIGFTRDAPETRVRQMQIGCPWPIALMGSVAGSIFHEQAMQARYAASRMTGEWFKPTLGLLTEIENVLSPGFVWPVSEPAPIACVGSTGDFLAEIEAFLVDTGLTATAFGVRAMKDPKFVHDIRKEGRHPSLRLVDRARLFMSQRREGVAA